MAALTYGRSFFRGAKYVPADVRRAMDATVEAIAADAELPGPDDVPDIIPPALHCWRRRIPATAWWVFFELRADGSVVVVAVAVPP